MAPSGGNTNPGETLGIAIQRGRGDRTPNHAHHFSFVATITSNNETGRDTNTTTQRARQQAPIHTLFLFVATHCRFSCGPEGTSAVAFPVGQAPRQGDNQRFTAVRRVTNIWNDAEQAPCELPLLSIFSRTYVNPMCVEGFCKLDNVPCR